MRFDHVVIAVRDLDDAVARFTRAGFDVVRGGRHSGWGTHNAVIRFENDYLELLSVYDAAAMQSRGAPGHEFVEFLRRREGFIGWAVATAAIEDVAQRLAATDIAPLGPFPMERITADGFRLTWKLLFPGGMPWRRYWPFIIEWDVSDAEHARIEPAGTHENHAIGVRAIRIETGHDRAADTFYGEILGLARSERPGSEAAGFALDGERDIFFGPSGGDEGPTLMHLTVSDLDATRLFMHENGVNYRGRADGSLEVGGAELCGTLFRLFGPR